MIVLINKNVCTVYHWNKKNKQKTKTELSFGYVLINPWIIFHTYKGTFIHEKWFKTLGFNKC